MNPWNLFRKIINKWRLNTCLGNLMFINESWRPKVDTDIIENTRQILLHIESFMPIQCVPTYRNSIQLEWKNKDKSYMEFEIDHTQVKCMIMSYFGNQRVTTALYEFITKNTIRKTIDLQSYKTMNQVINDFMNGNYDEICKLD